MVLARSDPCGGGARTFSFPLATAAGYFAVDPVERNLKKDLTSFLEVSLKMVAVDIRRSMDIRHPCGALAEVEYRR